MKGQKRLHRVLLLTLLVSFSLARDFTPEEILTTEFNNCQKTLTTMLALIPEEKITANFDSVQRTVRLIRPDRFDTVIRLFKKKENYVATMALHDFLYPGLKAMEIWNLDVNVSEPDTEVEKGPENDASHSSEDHSVVNSFCQPFLNKLRGFPFYLDEVMPNNDYKEAKRLFVDALTKSNKSLSCTECNQSESPEQDTQESQEQNASESEPEGNASQHEIIKSDAVEAKHKYEKSFQETKIATVTLTDTAGNEVGKVMFAQPSYLGIEAQASLYGHTFTSEFSMISLRADYSPAEKLADALIKVSKNIIVKIEEIKKIIEDSFKLFKCPIEALTLTYDENVLALNLVNTSPDLGEKLPELTYLDDPIEEENEADKSIENSENADDLSVNSDGESELINKSDDNDLENKSFEDETPKKSKEEIPDGNSFNEDDHLDEEPPKKDDLSSNQPPEKEEPSSSSKNNGIDEKKNDGSNTSRRLKTIKETRNSNSKISLVIPRKSRLMSSDDYLLSPIAQEEKIFGQPKIIFGGKLVSFGPSNGRKLGLAEIYDEECPFKDLIVRINEIKTSDFPLIQFLLKASENFHQPVLLEYFLRRTTKEQLQNKIQHLMKSFASSLLYLRGVAEKQAENKGDREALLSLEDMKDAAHQVLAQKNIKGKIEWKDNQTFSDCYLDTKKIMTFSFKRAKLDLPHVMITFHKVGVEKVFPILTHDLIISARKNDFQIEMFTKQFEEFLDTASITI